MTTVDAPSPESFDHYARLVKRLLQVPVGLVSLVRPDRQVFAGASGLSEPYLSARETPLSHSLCQYVVKDERPLVISDARRDPRLRESLAIEELDVVAYAGWPLTDHSGRTIGSLCAVDNQPRTWTSEELETLEDLATACNAELNERQRVAATAAALSEAERLGERSRALLGLSTSLSFTETIADVSAAVTRVSTDELGCVRAGMWLRRLDATQAALVAPLTPGVDHREELRFVDAERSSWLSATRSAALPLDLDNPLGAPLLTGVAEFYSSRAEQNERYPAFLEAHQVGEARAFLPLVAGGHAYGGLALVWPTQRAFSDQDRITIQALASYTAQAVHRAQLTQERVDVSLALQTAMLTRLPRPDHLELAARYLPAAAREQVGGDWYDAVVMPGGSTHLMIGDVMGHDIEAATVMGQLRSMLRMASWMSGSPPATDVERLDLAMRDLGVETMASVVLARIERTEDDEDDALVGRRRLRWANAGHLPPLLLAPDGSTRWLEADHADPILGIAPDRRRVDHEAVIEPDSLLLLYTDGLVERRGEAIDVGLARLLDAARGAAGLVAEAFVDQVLAELVSDSPDDDVAVLAVRFAAGTATGSR